MDHKKAIQFMAKAAEFGWESSSEVKGDETHVTAIRGGEKLTIWWKGNALIASPQYSYMGRKVGTHNTAGAYRQLAAKPVIKPHRRRRAILQDQPETEQPIVRHELPFDILESPKSEILKAIRGNTLTWLNGMTGKVETSMVPYKVSDKGGVRLFNTDLKSTFYLKTGRNGRQYVSFMDPNGVYRAVYLDSILQVA